MTAFTLSNLGLAARSPVTLSPMAAGTAIILIVAFGLRLFQFGNPIAGLDDQFYLLVGDRLWSGALPYVNIWDRKPAGLFLLYGAIRALPGDGIVAYQTVGTLFLALTGVMTMRIALTALPIGAAVLAGLMVVAYGNMLGAGFGEAPVFYDLFTAIAGACVLSLPGDGRVTRRAIAAMVLCGVSLTLKTSAVFESICFGAMLLHRDWRSDLRPAARLGRAALYAACGLAPTATVAAFYWWHGAWDVFYFANFQSPFLRSGATTIDSYGRLVGLLLLLTPLTVPAMAEWRHIPAERRRFLTAWLAAGLLSFVAIGRFYEHYALPLVTPLALIAAYGFRRWAIAALAAVPVAFLLAGSPIGYSGGMRRDRDDIAAMVAALPVSVRTQCLFVYEGPLILYHLSHACLPSRYVFSGHYTEKEEDGALEKPMADILQETLARKPAAIVSVPDLRGYAPPTKNDRILRAELARYYHPVARQEFRLYGARRFDAVIWQRR